ncbi:unnamed protein product [Closterium sp. NIES-53]
MVPRRDLFTTYHSLPPNSRNVIVGSGDTLQAIGIGTITVKGKEGEVLNLKGVLHVPGLAANLLSCSQLARQEYICTFTMGGCTVRKRGAVVMEAKLEKGLYLVPVCVPHGVEIKEGGGQPSKCPDCTTGKLPRTSFPTSTTRASAPLELVHTDVCGPMQTPEREKGSKYFITFLDDFSRLSWVTLVKTKDEVAKVFKRWIRYAEREAGAKVKILRSDQGGEYMGKDLESFLEDKGITHQLSVAYTPQQNGAAERLNQTLIDLARVMLAHAQLDHTWWGAAVQYANWVKNRMGSKGLEGKSPYFMWTRKSVKEALSRPEWVESMREELESHKVNESFELVDPDCVPPGMEVLRCQWVWKYKHKADGSIERPKSRLVAMGNTQTRGVHYDQEGVWLKRLFGEFGHELAGGVPVFVDNKSAIALARNACLHGRTKHMQVRWHFIREMVASGEVILRWCPTNRQAADILTKPLHFERHGVCMSLMGMQPHVGMEPEQDVGGLVLLCLEDIMLWTTPLPGQGGVE